MGYLDNWMKMLSGAGAVEPVQAAGPPVQSAMPQRPPANPMTGEPRSMQYGQDVNLPNADQMAKVEFYKKMGYPEETAVRLAMTGGLRAHAGVRARKE